VTHPKPPSRRRHLIQLVLGLTCAFAAVVPVSSQTASSDEVKAAFLYNFTKFVGWSAAAAAGREPMTVGVIGNDAVADALKDIVRGKLVDGRQLAARRVTAKDDLSTLHVLFIGTSEESRIGEVFKQLGTAGVLTVSDVPGFCARGGMIEFLLADDRVRFDINLVSAEQSGLTLNSKLLALAKSIVSTKEPGVAP
jgi:hypothetical protein